MISSIDGSDGLAAAVGNLVSLDMLDLHDNRIQGSLDFEAFNLGKL